MANINIDDKKLGEEFQKTIVDVEPLRLAFYCVLAGYRVIYIPITQKRLGQDITKIQSEVLIDRNSAIMNEKGANYLYNSILPLISAMATTSNVNDQEIYNLYSGRLDSISFALLDNILLEKNTYQFKPNRMNEVISFLCTLYLITKKANKGFTLTQLAQSFITSVIQRNDLTPIKKEGILDSVKKAFK